MTDEQNSSKTSSATSKPWHVEDLKKKTSLYWALGIFVVVIIGLAVAIQMASNSSTAPTPTPTPTSSEAVSEEEEIPEPAPSEENAQGLSIETVEDLASSSTDGDGLIDFIQYNPAESTYTVVVRNTSAADETYGVTVLVDGEPAGAQGVEVPASSTATTTVEVSLPRGTDEVTLRLDGERLGEGIVEALHEN